MANNSFTNTFEKGLNSDFQILYQPDGTYRYMKNCQLISQDGNNYAVKDCMGNTLMFTINPPYLSTYNSVGTLPTPIMFISFPDKLVVGSTNNEGSGGYFEIGVVKTLDYGQGIQPKSVTGEYNAGYVPLYHHVSLNATIQHRCEGFALSENELIERIYWTDNYNEPRVFNVSDPIYTTYFTPTAGVGDNPVVNGNTYMVVEGAVTYNGVNYGPGLIAGNVFTANATNTFTDLTNPTPTAKVIAYYPYRLLDFLPSRSMGGISYVRYGSGNVICGNKIYFYRLGKSDGVKTSWSYGSSPIHVGTLNETDYIVSNAYHDFVGGGTETATLNSQRSVFVSIDNVDTDWDYIELACAEFDQLIDVPRQITVVNRTEITSATMTIEHTGNDLLEELTIGDITLFPASVLKCKTMTTSKGYMVIGNTEERQELDLDLSTVTVTSFQYPMNVHSDPGVCGTGGMLYSGAVPNAVGSNPAAGSITPWSRWLVISGTPSYDGNSYSAGDVIVGTSTDDTIVGGQVRACVTRNRYTPIGTTDRVENAIALSSAQGSGYWTPKDPLVHHHCTGNWSGEKYRYALLPIDKKGNPFYAQWMADYTMPTINAKGGLIRSDVNLGGDSVYSLNPSGVKFSGIRIPADVVDQISGFCIVRAERDPIIVTQGLVTQCVHSGASPDVYRPASYIPLSKDAQGASVDPVYCFMCPDSLVGIPLKAAFGQVGDTMKEAGWLSPYDFAGEAVKAAGGRDQVYSKIIDFQTTDSADRTRTITYFNTVDEGDFLTDLGSGDSFQNGNMEVGAAAGTAPNISCIPGSGGAYSLDARKSTAGKKAVIKLSSDFPHYGTADGYASVAAGANKLKILMNYSKSGVDVQNLYGGSGDQAKANTLYISTGHFQPITAQVIADTCNTGNVNSYDYLEFNNVEVFGGDCHVNLIDIGYSLWDTVFNAMLGTFSYAWTFPCENNSNYDLRRGRKTSNVQLYFQNSGDGPAPAESIVYDDGSANPTRLEDYSYNQSYSSEGQAIRYPALPVNYINAAQFKYRTRWAGPKFFGEIVNSFRNFAITDYRDLDGQGGEINNIKVRDGRVIVWQNKMVVTLPILERQLLGAPTGDATTIGTGGVIDRFDPLTSFYGNQHQWSLIETEFGYVWFDMRNKAFMTLNVNGGILNESRIKGLDGFFNEVFLEAIGENVINENTFLNSPTYDNTSDRPLTGVGITGVFDPKFHMTYMVFKFSSKKKLNGDDVSQSKDFTIGYLQTDKDRMFVGFYDMNFSIAHNHNQFVVMANNPKNTTQFTPISFFGLSFVVGETIPYINREFICIVAVTIDDVAKLPFGASGTTYWEEVNKTNQLWVLNQPSALGQATAPGYLYNKFFGKVVDNVVTFVVNPQMPEDQTFFVPNGSEITPSNVNYTSVETEGNLQTAADTGITSTTRTRRFVFDKIQFSYPLSSTGRIFSNYLKVTFTKKNYTTSPTTLATSTKVLQKVISWFTVRK